MRTNALGRVFVSVVVMIAVFSAAWSAEKPQSKSLQDLLALINSGNVKKSAEGPFETKDGGLLGFVTEHMANNIVKFTSCGNVTVSLDFDLLKRSTANCPPAPGGGGPWNVASKFIAPVTKENTGAEALVVKFQGKTFDLTGKVSTHSKDSIASMAAGTPVGFAFTDDKGQKALALFNAQFER